MGATGDVPGGPAQRLAGDELIEVDLEQGPGAGVGEREAEREERTLGAGALIEHLSLRRGVAGSWAGRPQGGGTVLAGGAFDQRAEPGLGQLEPGGDAAQQLVPEQTAPQALEGGFELVERAVAPFGAREIVASRIRST